MDNRLLFLVFLSIRMNQGIWNRHAKTCLIIKNEKTKKQEQKKQGSLYSPILVHTLQKFTLQITTSEDLNGVQLNVCFTTMQNKT